MSKKNISIMIISIIVAIILLLCIVMGCFFIADNARLNAIDSTYNRDDYKDAVLLDGIEVFEQQVSCGYATIEMVAKYFGILDVTEQSLYDEYGKVVTSTGKSFEKTFNSHLHNVKATMYKYLTNKELLDKTYHSLQNGVPVPIEWAAKLGDTWTLHYSIIVGMDVKDDKVTVVNPYGYVKKITVEELLSRTTFKAYDNKPLLIKFAFAFSIFERNTIFILDRI